MYTPLVGISILAYVLSAFILSARLGDPNRMRRRALILSLVALVHPRRGAHWRVHRNLIRESKLFIR